MKILTNLGETEINNSHVSESRNDLNKIKLGGSITTDETTDETTTNRATLIAEGQTSGFFCSKSVFKRFAKYPHFDLN